MYHSTPIWYNQCTVKRSKDRLFFENQRSHGSYPTIDELVSVRFVKMSIREVVNRGVAQTGSAHGSGP